MGALEQQSSCHLQVLGTHPQVQGAKGWRMSCTWCKQGPGVQWQPWIPPQEAPAVPPWGACTLCGPLAAQRQHKLTPRTSPFSTPNHQCHVSCKTAEAHVHRSVDALHPSIRPLKAVIFPTHLTGTSATAVPVALLRP